MNIDELKKCTRPLIFENVGNESFTYRKWGSCFCIKFLDNYYVVTAKHLIKDINEKTLLCIQYRHGSENFLPYKDILSPENINEEYEDTGQFDFCVIVIPKEELNEDEFDGNTFFNITDITFSIADFKFGKICGYPLEINPINYEEFKIRQQMLELSIIDIKKSDYENVFRFESDEKNEIYTQGLSGSPICEIVNNLSINLRGIVTNNRHFISFSLIKTFLECTIEQNK